MNENNTNDKVHVSTPGAGTNDALNKAQEVGQNISLNKPEVPETPKKMIEVDANVLQKLISQIDAAEEKLKDLEGAADLGRLARVQEARNKGKLLKTAKVSMYGDKLILGWRTVENDVFIDADGKLHETQKIELILDEGEGKEPSRGKIINQTEFSRVVTKVKGEVVRESKDDDGQTFQTVMFPDGRKVELSIVFLN